MKQRRSGILMHISSLPSPYGIGNLGQAAYDFVDFLKKSQQSYWQILPMGVTSYGDSPYQAFSAFAGNPNFIDLDDLVAQGWLTSAELEGIDFGQDPERVDYEKLFIQRHPLLELAASRFLAQADLTDFQEFCQRQAFWLDDFALYMALKLHFDLAAWQDWPEVDIRQAKTQAKLAYREQLAPIIAYHQVVQYFFFKQWLALKNYANQAGIALIGDLPIYIASDSADMWTAPENFKTDEDGKARVVAGCPPDAFSETGQLWGNPIYDWEAMAQNGYHWWLQRLQASFQMYDVIRIDHFRGFEAYWQIPAEQETAVKGEWVKGPGLDFFNTLTEQLGPMQIIAEDLGIITDQVRQLREATGFPGMKVLQFAFDPDGDSDYLPHHITRDSVVYTGTHDNNTSRGWYEEDLTEQQRRFFDQYSYRQPQEPASQTMLRLAWASPAWLAIAPMQDLLDLPAHTRMNLPATLGQNWQWRMKAEALTDELAQQLAQLTQLYRRQP